MCCQLIKQTQRMKRRRREGAKHREILKSCLWLMFYTVLLLLHSSIHSFLQRCRRSPIEMNSFLQRWVTLRWTPVVLVSWRLQCAGRPLEGGLLKVNRCPLGVIYGPGAAHKKRLGSNNKLNLLCWWTFSVRVPQCICCSISQPSASFSTSSPECNTRLPDHRPPTLLTHFCFVWHNNCRFWCDGRPTLQVKAIGSLRPVGAGPVNSGGWPRRPLRGSSASWREGSFMGARLFGALRGLSGGEGRGDGGVSVVVTNNHRHTQHASPSTPHPARLIQHASPAPHARLNVSIQLQPAHVQLFHFHEICLGKFCLNCVFFLKGVYWKTTLEGKWHLGVEQMEPEHPPLCRYFFWN